MGIIINKETPVFSISAAAKLLNISVHTLRMYEREGLIVPFQKESGHRLYSQSDIERLRCIRSAINESKISIAGIKTIYSLIPCWEITGCSDNDKKNCSAYSEHGKPCWTYSHHNNICAVLECRDCSVYKNHTECGTIKETIINILEKQ